MGEQNNARIKGARSMPIIDEHLHFLQDLASIFTSRLAQAHIHKTVRINTQTNKMIKIITYRVP